MSLRLAARPRPPPPRSPLMLDDQQLYLSLYLQLLPLPSIIQTEIVPVVRPPAPLALALAK